MPTDLPLQDVHFYLMERIMRRARVMTREAFHEHNIPVSSDQWVILKTVVEQEGSSQQEVSESTFREPAAITRMLDHLIRLEMIEKRVDANDRRRQLLFATTQGKALYDEALPLVQQMREHAQKTLSEQERGVLRQLLRKMMNSIEEPFG